MSLPEPSFIDRDPAAITAEMVAQYEALTKKTLYPAQVERLRPPRRERDGEQRRFRRVVERR